MTDRLDALLWPMSPERLEPYLRVCGGVRDTAVDLYDWNIDVSAAFGRPLHYFEVVLRNAVHREMTAWVGRPDWWFHVELHKPARMAVNAAVNNLARQGKDVTPSRVIAELSLGFWVGMVSKRHNYEMLFWRPAVHRAFPGYRGKPGELHEKLDTVRRLRNRISHLEPIHHRHLEADYEKIILLIGYMAPDVAVLVEKHDGVRQALARRPDVRGRSDRT